MRAADVDRYSSNSTLYGFDPRVKLVGSIALVVALSFVRDIAALVLAIIFLLAVLAVSRVPLRHFAGTFALALPLIALAAVAMLLTSTPGAALAMFLRISASVMALLLLVTTTPFFDVLWALRWFRVPYIICALLLFTYRYIFVMLDEMERMSMARKARGFSNRGSLLSREVFKTISYTAGMVLVRSYKRGQDIYDGLVSRGYRGEIRTIRKPKVRARDAAYMACFAGMAAIITLMQWGVLSSTL